LDQFDTDDIRIVHYSLSRGTVGNVAAFVFGEPAQVGRVYFPPRGIFSLNFSTIIVVKKAILFFAGQSLNGHG